jgi:hypothetical protein
MRSHLLRRGSRLLAVVMGCLIVVSLGAGSANADVVVPLSQTADTTWHTNGMVRAIAQVGDRVYLGGQFSELRERSIQRTGGATIAVANLGAFDAATGTGLADFAPVVASATTTPTVYAMAVWNQRLFVGGKFSLIDGVAVRNLAAIDVNPSSATYGDVISSFKPNPTGTVWALDADATSLYVGGKFGKVGGASHPNVARFSIAPSGTTTLDAGWNVATDGTTTEGGRLRDIQIDPDHAGSVYLVGHFYTVTDSAQTYNLRNIARIGPGGLIDTAFSPPQSSFGVSNFGLTAYVNAATDHVFLGTGGSDWIASYSTVNGSLSWKTDTNGQAQSVTMVGGALVLGGHFTFAAYKPGYLSCGSTPDPEFCAQRTRIAAFDPSNGWLDLEWVPTVTGGYNGVWRAVPSNNGSQLWIGGQLKFVSGVQHSYVARLGPA